MRLARFRTGSIGCFLTLVLTLVGCDYLVLIDLNAPGFLSKVESVSFTTMVCNEDDPECTQPIMSDTKINYSIGGKTELAVVLPRSASARRAIIEVTDVTLKSLVGESTCSASLKKKNEENRFKFDIPSSLLRNDRTNYSIKINKLICENLPTLTVIDGSASNNIWAIGPSAILHFDGDNWTILSPENTTTLPAGNFNHIFVSRKSGFAWVVGDNGTLLRLKKLSDGQYEGKSCSFIGNPSLGTAWTDESTVWVRWKKEHKLSYLSASLFDNQSVDCNSLVSDNEFGPNYINDANAGDNIYGYLPMAGIANYDDPKNTIIMVVDVNMVDRYREIRMRKASELKWMSRRLCENGGCGVVNMKGSTVDSLTAYGFVLDIWSASSGQYFLNEEHNICSSITGTNCQMLMSDQDHEILSGARNAGSIWFVTKSQLWQRQSSNSTIEKQCPDEGCMNYTYQDVWSSGTDAWAVGQSVTPRVSPGVLLGFFNQP